MDVALVGRVVASLAVIGLILWAVQHLARTGARWRLAGAASGRIVNVLETTVLPNAASLHVIEIAERWYVVGRSDAHIALLCEIPAERVAQRLAARRPAAPRRCASSS